MFLKALDELYHNKNICKAIADSRGQNWDTFQYWNKKGPKIYLPKNKGQFLQYFCQLFKLWKPESILSPNDKMALPQLQHSLWRT